MKKSWSSKWVSSSQPRKQRKYRYNAPLHARRKFLSAHISKELRERFGKRAVAVRKGDEVLVMKGEYKGFRGNVDSVDLAGSRIYVDGMKRKKVDGSEISVPIQPSNVMITKLSLDDKRRQAVFERAGPRKEGQKANKREKASQENPDSDAFRQATKAERKKELPEAKPAKEESRLKTEVGDKPTSSQRSPSGQKPPPGEHPEDEHVKKAEHDHEKKHVGHAHHAKHSNKEKDW
jgi:large subunit ribosomal protein L24